jgi:hypothetical protein
MEFSDENLINNDIIRCLIISCVIMKYGHKQVACNNLNIRRSELSNISDIIYRSAVSGVT